MAILVVGTDKLVQAPIITREEKKYGASVGMWLGDPDLNGDLMEPQASVNLHFNGVKHLNHDKILYKTFENNAFVHSVSFPDLVDCSGDYALSATFQGAEDGNNVWLTSISFPALKSVVRKLNEEPFDVLKEGHQFYFFNHQDVYGVDITSLPEMTVSFPELETIKSQEAFGEAFYYTPLTHINLNKLKTIGNLGEDPYDGSCDNVFYNAFTGSRLHELYLPALTTIDVQGAFAYSCQNCLELTSVSCPALTSTGNNMFESAFAGCQVLHEVDFPVLTNMGNGAFAGAFSNTPLQSNEINFGSLKSVADSGFSFAFSYCYNLVDISFLSEIKYVGSRSFLDAFQGCTGLNSVVSFPNITSIGQATECFKQAFLNCSNIPGADLTSFNSLSGTNAFQETFKGCTWLKSITFKPECKWYYQSSGYMFRDMCYGCTRLETFVFPAAANDGSEVRGCQQLFYNMFYNCSKLKTVIVPVTTLPSGGNSAANNACQYMFRRCTGADFDPRFPRLKTISANNAMQSIFLECSGSTFTKMHFPRLTTISGSSCFMGAFQGCSHMQNIYFWGANSFGSNKNQFSVMLNGLTTNCTVHFRKSVQTVLSSWADVIAKFGDANATVLFDLVYTITVNGTVFYRDPYSDTATASCWETNDGTTKIFVSGATTIPDVNTITYTDDTLTTQYGTVTAVED